MIGRLTIVAVLAMAFAGCVSSSGKGGCDECLLLAQEAMAGRNFRTVELTGGFVVKYLKADDGSLTVVVFNPNNADGSVTLCFTDLETGGAFKAYDCCTREDEGIVWGEFATEVPQGSAKLFSFTRVRCPRCN